MKKILFAFMVLSSMNTFAQKIELDKVEKGERFIICSLENVRSMSDKVVFKVGLSVGQNKTGNTLYSILLNATAATPLTVPKNGKLLIKLMDDSTLELNTSIEYSDKIGKVNNVGGYVYTAYTITPSFNVTPEQIDKIKQGVKKIRLETSLEPIDKNFKKDKIGKVIEKEYSLIKNALSKKKSFSDGF
ncbi:hypothetical protein [uncultured Bacteroides sp.]|uniref:hypothetical protein n=1 Tax=uncultured Bacteroides sp. TaxID=162156 RepID=UPI002AAC1D1B|nr:hypothetical protein [uncultured Bacteroides sp.]